MNTLALLDAIRTIAQNGLGYSKDLYDIERYEKLLSLASESYEEITGLDEDYIHKQFKKEIVYVTPKVGADADIFDNDGKVLLIDRADGTGWCMPCGWLDPNERPIEASIRETYEETGLTVEVDALVGVFTHLAGEPDIITTHISIIHLCKKVGGEISDKSHEVLEVRYWHIDKVPKWHGAQEKLVRQAHKMKFSKQIEIAVSD